MARGLRAIAGRLTPVEDVPVAAQETAAVEDTAGGPPGHWLEMVRRRAPGLHVSLQERGLACMARQLAPISAAPSPSALEPRGRQSGAPRWSAPSPVSAASPASAAALPVACLLRPMSAASAVAPASQLVVAHPDLEPHTWDSAVLDEDQQDWTRVPTRRSDPTTPTPSHVPPAAVPAVRRLSAADAAVAETCRQSASPADVSLRSTDRRHESAPRGAHGNTQRAPTRPELRPLPAVVAPDTTRHSTATPAFAPSRDEDQALRRPVRARVNFPTPVPTPWPPAALQATADELATPGFPSLPDEASSAHQVRGSGARSSTSARPVQSSLPPPSPVPIFPARRHSDSKDLIGAWPTLPSARVPALRASSESWLSTADRWPELPGDESEEGNDPDQSLPSGHRERLDREQRGLSWNG